MSFETVRPSKPVRRRAVLRQALRLPKTLFAIRRLIAEDYAPDVLDEHLWAFRAFHDGEDDPRWLARQWTKVPLRSIGPGNVIGLPVWEFAFMSNVAREIEEPIVEYSHQNGEGFRFLLPSLARFLGKNHDAAAYAAAHNLSWCESPWCAEERRHAPAFARIIERLTGSSPAHTNPNQPKAVTASEADAVQLVLSREAAEWNSSSTYLVLAAHGTGDLHLLVRNLARDEIKHLAILSAADLYLFGPRPWRRFADLVGRSLAEYRGHRKKRSSGDLIGTNTVTAIEVMATHLLSELSIRRWLKTLELVTLEFVFEGPSRLPEFAVGELTPQARKAADAALREGRAKRASLSRWRRGRERALKRCARGDTTERLQLRFRKAR
jgi:hypothetical protein